MADEPEVETAIPPTATYTFAEWCALDEALVAADVADYDLYYKPTETVMPTPAPGSAFAAYYGPSSEQKMDRATLDLRLQSMKDALAAADVAAGAPPPTADPAQAASYVAPTPKAYGSE
jgi:hypothetical protein